jgi:hypothetical protein
MKKANHEYSYQSYIINSHELLKVLELAMFAMGPRWFFPQLNTNVYHHHTHADRRSMGLLASTHPPLRQSRFQNKEKP